MPKTKRTAKTKPLTRKATFVRGKHLVIDKARAPARTANVVQRAALNPVDPNDPNAPKVRAQKDEVFFKPHSLESAPSQYAVASTRLARFLDMEKVIAHNAFAKVKNVRGVVSGAAPGEPLLTTKRDTEVKPQPDWDRRDIQMWMDGAQIVERDGKYWDVSRYVYEWVNFKDPRIQKGLSDLQLFDAISGQTDRHGGNIFVNPQTGEVTGIDDDRAFGSGTPVANQKVPSGKYVGLPALVDQKTAERILALDPTNLPEELFQRENDSEVLTQKEIEDAVLRFVGVQLYLRELQKRGALVGQNGTSWDDATYQQALQAPTSSYLGRQAAALEDALQRSAANDPMYAVDGAPPPDTPPPPPVAPATTTPTMPAPALNIPLNMPRLPPQPRWQPRSPRMAVVSPSRAAEVRWLATTARAQAVSATPPAEDLDSSGDTSDDSTTTSADDQLLSEQ